MARKEGEKMRTLSSYLFWSTSCREIPESQSTSPAGRSRTQTRSRDQGTAGNWALSRHLMRRKVSPEDNYSPDTCGPCPCLSLRSGGTAWHGDCRRHCHRLWGPWGSSPAWVRKELLERGGKEGAFSGLNACTSQ